MTRYLLDTDITSNVMPTATGDGMDHRRTTRMLGIGKSAGAPAANDLVATAGIKAE